MSRVTSRRRATGDDEDDVEGHKQTRATGDDDDDVEGHKQTR